MICVNCDQEMLDGLEQCPYCGCNYPEKKKDAKHLTPSDLDKTQAAKQIKALIDAAASKGIVTEKERDTILRTAKANNLDPDVAEIMLDSALIKAKQTIMPANAQELSVSSVDIPDTIEPSSTRYCEHCGTPLAPGTVFCKKCGQKA